MLICQLSFLTLGAETLLLFFTLRARTGLGASVDISVGVAVGVLLCHLFVYFSLFCRGRIPQHLQTVQQDHS